MKRYFLITIAALSFLLFAESVYASQKNMDVNLKLTGRFVELSGKPHFTAKGSGKINYDSMDGGVKLDNGSMPKLIFESKNPPEGFEALTVVITGIIGTKSNIDWSNMPQIDLNGLALHIEAYDAHLDEIDSLHPFVEMNISGINLSTKPITVGGVSSGGYLDAKKMEAQLAGKIIAPNEHDGLYNEHIAGKPVLLEFVIQLRDLFKKSDRREAEPEQIRNIIIKRLD